MDKYKLMRIVNLILLFSFLLQCITSMIIFFRIKTPVRQMIFEIHEYNGLVMIMLAMMHVVLNWSWIKANYLTYRKKT